MTLKGIDISKWQSGLDLSRVKCDFVVVKATEGIGYVDKACDPFFQKAKSLGKPVGFYHFARPINDAVKEADFFVTNTKNYFGNAFPLLDWEAENKWDVGWAKRFLDEVYKLTNVRPAIYMSESVANNYDWSSVVNGNYGLWIAKYRDNVADANYNMANAGTKPNKGKWPFYCMWQWTSVGRLDGYSGNLDCDEFYGDTNTWNKYAGKVVGTAAVAPSTAPQVVEAKPTADQIAQYIVAGTNGWNGVYGEERYTKLATLGYNAAEVQQKVNALMGMGHTTVNTAKYVTVQAGNTLSGIAAANGTTWQKLQSINGISNPNRIYVGQRIRVK